MKRKCLNCPYSLIDDWGDPISCTYGLQDGAMYIGVFCPKDKKRIRNTGKGTWESTPHVFAYDFELVK